MNNTYVKQNASLPAAQRAELNAVNGLVFSLPGPFATGQYLAQWTNTSTGHIVRTDTVTCEGNAVFATCMALRLEVPDFVLDVALVLNYTISARQANPDSEASEEPIVPGSPSPAFTLELLNGSSIRYVWWMGCKQTSHGARTEREEEAEARGHLTCDGVFCLIDEFLLFRSATHLKTQTRRCYRSSCTHTTRPIPLLWPCLLPTQASTPFSNKCG